jgi:hypothetical protein
MLTGMSMQNPTPIPQDYPLDTGADREMQRLKACISQVWAQRESLKQALNQGAMPPSQGLRDLEGVDRELAELDTCFKRLWDATNAMTHANPEENP